MTKSVVTVNCSLPSLYVYETTMSYRPPYAVTVRAPHGIDLRAEHFPWHCGP